MGTNTLTGLAIVSVGLWTRSRNIIAGIRGRTPRSSVFESQAIAAVIRSLAAIRNRYTGFEISAPSLVFRARALTSLTVVVIRAIGGNVITFVRDVAPACVLPEGETVSAVIAGQAAGRNIDARRALAAPGLI